MAKLLVVDDNEMSGELYRRMLGQQGYEVVVAPDGLSGLAMARSETPDLIVMDMSMPGLDGWQASRRLKADPATAGIPIIALTGHALPEDRANAIAAGCDEYESKPARLNSLLSKIQTLLVRSSQNSGGTRPLWPLPTGVDEETLKRLRHDLRTPLNQILGYTELVIEAVAGDDRASELSEGLRQLHAAGGEILALLNEGLAHWKVGAGKTDLIGLRSNLLVRLDVVLKSREQCARMARTLNLPEALSDLDKIDLASRDLRRILEQDSFAERYHLGSPASGGSLPPLPVVDPPKVVSSESRAASPRPSHILVVDDEPLNCDMLVRRLQRMGFTAQVASNGLEALELINRTSFDLVLLDILMPVLDGFRTLERLKADPKLRHIPVIMITALDEVSATVRCIEAGAEDYVAKPFNPVILRARIGASLERKRLRDQERAYLAEIQTERAKSERLLLNVLPKAIGERLKHGEKMIVDSVAAATVIFADIVNFTGIATHMTPARTVTLLNELFSDFDQLVERMGVEKIKTIGDAYMVVGGVPVPMENHAERCAEMALAMLESLLVFNLRTGQNWQIRIGMHTGPVVAGIIGSKKFAYDLWGDTVNIASRLESHGEPGTIQVSRATSDILADKFLLEPRGGVALKNRGEMMAYRLIGRRDAV